MSKKRLPVTKVSDQNVLLEQQIQILQKELDQIRAETRVFEALLRSHVSDLIIEATELFVLYKKIKKAKKAKRLEQKKRGKNYKAPKAVVAISKKKVMSSSDKNEQKEKKRLYREAMLYVHPDNFFMDEDDSNKATEITSRLVEIYKSGDLETLKAYHAHIFSGAVNIQLKELPSKVIVVAKDDFFEKEIERLEKELILVKNKHIYKILTEYENPLSFVDELKIYYEDRIFKLKKRTRKGI